MRLTNDQLLTARRINLVPLSHGFQAGAAGARGLDITTRLCDRQPTPYLALEEEPVAAGDRICRARWTD